MAFVSVYFSLGSNLGDRQKNLISALNQLDNALGCHYKEVSKIIESDAWKFKGGKFLNCVVLYRIFKQEGNVEDVCMNLLKICKDIEKDMGRTDIEEYDEKGERVYHSRIIDIDILFYGTERVNTQKITIPHKNIADRPFVMIPLLEIAKPSLKEAFPEIFGINSLNLSD